MIVGSCLFISILAKILLEIESSSCFQQQTNSWWSFVTNAEPFVSSFFLLLFCCSIALMVSSMEGSSSDSVITGCWGILRAVDLWKCPAQFYNIKDSELGLRGHKPPSGLCRYLWYFWCLYKSEFSFIRHDTTSSLCHLVCAGGCCIQDRRWLSSQGDVCAKWAWWTDLFIASSCWIFSLVSSFVLLCWEPKDFLEVCRTVMSVNPKCFSRWISDLNCRPAWKSASP